MVLGFYNHEMWSTATGAFRQLEELGGENGGIVIWVKDRGVWRRDHKAFVMGGSSGRQ